MVKLPRIRRRVPRGWPRFNLLSSVRGRIIAGFSFLVFILVGVAAGSAWQVHEHQSDTADMEEHTDTAFLLQSARVNAEATAAGIQRYVMVGGQTEVAQDETLVPEMRSDIAAAQESLTQALSDAEMRGDREQAATLYQISAEADSLIAGVEMIIALQESGDTQAAAEGLEVAVAPFEEFSDKLEAAAETELQEVSALRSRADRAGDFALWLLIISGASGAVIGLAISVFVARSIIKPLSALEETATAISEGDLEARARATGPRELGRLGASFNQMTESLLRDIAERKRAERVLRESEERYRDLFENANDLIQSVAMDGSFDYVNRAWHETLGYSEEEIRSLNMFDIVHPDSRDHCLEMFKRVIAGERLDHVEAEFVTKKGRSIWVEGNAFARFRDGKPVATRGIFRDVTERKRAEEAVSHMAYHDALTDLPNRALLKDRLNLALAQAKRNKHMLAVMFLDLDQFKAVNDTAGHKQGDRLLQSVGKQLKELVREGDTVAREGGDEFILLLPEVTGAEHAATIADRILKSFQGPRVLAGHEFHITTSIGVTVYPADGGDAETLLRNADIAMYRAKEEGRDNFQIYSADMKVQIAERLALESDLRHALEREEFVVYYQPQVDIGTGQIVGTEALVRWRHPERGLVSPMEFIPLAEETGLIVELGEWVLRTACAQNKAWEEAGIPVMRVAVNVSSRQFQRRDLVETVMQVLNKTGLDADSLELEITESTAIQDVDHTIAVLRSLRDEGVRVAIDDFGTGYSALSYLKRLPIDTVKIDESFVRDITIDPDDAAIAATVITIAHDLKLSVIAEGVETEEQLAFLEERGCDEMQGYLFSKPLPPTHLEKLIKRGKRLPVVAR